MRFVICLVALLLFITSVVSAIAYRIAYNHELATIQSYPYKHWAVGDIVVSDNLAFRVNSVRTDQTQVPGYWELADGTQYVILNLSFTNRTDKEYVLSPIQTMFIEDETGKQYGVTSAPALVTGFGGQVKPNESVTGEVGLTVPKSLTKGVFVFEPRTKGDGFIFADIKF